MSIVCSFAVIAWLFPGCTAPSAELFPGYVEGEYAALAPVATARIKDLRVRRGDPIVPGMIIATLDNEETALGVSSAEAAVAEAAAQLENLQKGKRQAEIEAIRASLAAAKAEAESADLSLSRATSLLARGVATQASVDQARATAAVAAGRVNELQANLEAAQMPAREDEVRAAEARLAQAKSALAEARWAHQQRFLIAGTKGRVFDVVRRPGEIASPSQPIVSVLPEGAELIRFYAPEPALSALAVGTKVPVSCDGCPDDLTATVTYRASEPEFTPPVIYSIERRQKLVFLVEARPDTGNSFLQPGQIVSVSLPKAE
jgi:HlyD family secretion protein